MTHALKSLLSMRAWPSIALLAAVTACVPPLGGAFAGQGQGPAMAPTEDGPPSGVGGSTYGTTDGYEEYPGDPPAFDVPVAKERLVTVNVVQALIGIKSNQKPWDGVGSINQEAVRALEAALLEASVAGAFAAAAVEIGNLANSGLDSPDPFGTLEYFSSRGKLNIDIPLLRDTHSPNWNGLGVGSVPLDDPSVRFRITLWDKDISNHDPIGTVELNHQDLVAALDAARVYPVPVYQQGNSQFLFVGISVRAE